MTIDLWMLVASAVLFFALFYGQGFAVIKTIGAKGAAGNREAMPPMTGWRGRIDRAVRNHSDNLIVFAVLVAAAHLSDQANAVTAWSAVVFFASRVVHAVCYVAGITGLRTIAFNVGVVAMAVIFVQLF
jgi:uncharacterized MAPEG superfamily protein